MESVEPVERRGVGGMINDKLYLHVTEGYVIMQVTKGGSLCHVVKSQCCMVTPA